MSSLLEALLSPTGVGSFLKVIAVVPRSAPPQAPVPLMLSAEGATAQPIALYAVISLSFHIEYRIHYGFCRVPKQSVCRYI